MKHTWWVFGAAGVMMAASLASAASILRTPVKNGTFEAAPFGPDPEIVVDEDGETFENYSGSTWLSFAAINPNGLDDPLTPEIEAPDPVIANFPSAWVIDAGSIYDGKRSSGSGFNSSKGLADHKEGIYRIGFRNRRDLSPAEMANAGVVHGGTPTCVNGTDAHPLVFKFKLNLGTGGVYGDLNAYAEVTCGDDRAPTHVTSLVCNVPGVNANTRYKLNMAGDGEVHRSIAVGQIAWEDSDPCAGNSGSNEFSHSYRLTLFDGKTWRNLKTPVDMHTCNEHNRVTVTIKTYQIIVELKSLYNGTNCTAPDYVTYTTVVDRQYFGPFSAIKVGGLHDEVNGGIWGQDKVPADVDGTVRAYDVHETAFDDIELYDGEAYDTPGPCEVSGACCTGHACQQLTPTACAAIPGATFQGSGTVCWLGTGMCCGAPKVDFDFDKDVDMADFAALQRCLTTGLGTQATPLSECACFDVDGTPGISTQDVEKFVLCASGANVPWVASLDCAD